MSKTCVVPAQIAKPCFKHPLSPIGEVPLLRIKTLFRLSQESHFHSHLLSIVHMTPSQPPVALSSAQRSNHAPPIRSAAPDASLWLGVGRKVVVGDTGGCSSCSPAVDHSGGQDAGFMHCASHPCRYRYIDARDAAPSPIRPEADEPSSPDSFPANEQAPGAGRRLRAATAGIAVGRQALRRAMG